MKKFCVLMGFVLSLISSKPCQADLRAAGSDSTKKVVQALFDAFEAQTGITISATGGGSSVGAKAALNDEVHLAFMSRTLRENEVNNGLVAMPYAIDGVAIITHTSNPISDVTIEDLRKIYSGRIKLWANGKPLLLYNRDSNSGTRECFEKKVMQGESFGKSIRVATNLNIVGDAKKVQTAIGYTSASSVGESVKTLRINGVAPTPENLVSGKYPICRTLIFATKGPPTEEAKAFLDFVKSPQGQAAIESAGYVPLCDSESPRNSDGDFFLRLAWLMWLYPTVL